MNCFLDHCCFTTFQRIVFLTKIRFLDQNSQYSWLNSNAPQRFVSIAYISLKCYASHGGTVLSYEKIV